MTCSGLDCSFLTRGGGIVIKEVNSHWSDNLIPSPSKKDIIFQHVKGPGLHSYVEQPNGVKKYVCSPDAQCRSHQRHFMKNTTTALYKHFLQMYPLRRGKFCAGICVAAHSGVPFTISNVVPMFRDRYLLSLSQPEAFFCVQTCSPVSELYYFLIITAHTCITCFSTN